MEVKVPAKINLFLNVGKRTEDGFHDLISLMVKISLYDTMTLKKSEGIAVIGPEWLPQEENLVYKAAAMLKNLTGTDEGCAIILEKNIPSGRGLGGGSSDCAAALNALNELWETKVDKKVLQDIGSQLGSDVNFFLNEGTCFVTGKGEHVEQVEGECKFSGEILMIDTGIEISTKHVYDLYPGGKLTEKDQLAKIISNYRSGEWSEILKNDLEEVVYREFPVLKDLRNRLVNWGTAPLLSGSGSAIFAICENSDILESVAKIVEENFGYKTWQLNALL